MNNNQSVCTRCGKVRVVQSTTIEGEGNMKLTVRETVCPDPDCQNQVIELLAKERKIKEEKMASSRSQFGKR